MTVEQQIANLRLEVSALETATKVASLPHAVVQMRRTMALSALGVALALIVSSVIRMYDSDRYHSLEHRIELLERGLPHAPGM